MNECLNLEIVLIRKVLDNFNIKQIFNRQNQTVGSFEKHL